MENLLAIAIGLLLIYVMMKQIGSLFMQTKETSRSHFNLFLKLIKVRVTALGLLGIIFLAILIKLDVKAEIGNMASVLPIPLTPSSEDETPLDTYDQQNEQNTPAALTADPKPIKATHKTGRVNTDEGKIFSESAFVNSFE